MTQLVTLEGDQPDLYGYMENVIDNGDGTMSGDYISPELGRFKFKMPKMPKMRAMKGLSKSVGKAGKSFSKAGRSAGKAVSCATKAYGNAWKKVGKELEKCLRSAEKIRLHLDRLSASLCNRFYG